MLSVGLVEGYSERLSSVYNITKRYPSLPARFTVNAIKSGVFVSVQYSFLEN